MSVVEMDKRIDVSVELLFASIIWGAATERPTLGRQSRTSFFLPKQGRQMGRTMRTVFAFVIGLLAFPALAACLVLGDSLL